MSAVTVGLINLGCAKNLVDAELMLGMLRRAGVPVVADPRRASVVIVNTCAFIDAAKDEAIDEIMRVAAWKKRGTMRKLIVAGCLTQRYRTELPQLLPEVDGFVGTASAGDIVRVVGEVSGGGRSLALRSGRAFLSARQSDRVSLTPGHYAYVKISEGCDNCCSYCVIPRIRGKFHSRSIRSVYREIQEVLSRGVKEINIISQDTSRFGYDRYGHPRLAELLQRISPLFSTQWLRLLYLHPMRISPDLMHWINDHPYVCRYLDMPIQHCNDRLLRRMHRQTTQSGLRRVIDRVRKTIPGIALRTTVIVGFPGETDREFRQLLDFVREIRFDRLGVFAYSREEGTAAARMPGQIEESVKQSRQQELMRLQQQIAYAKAEAMVGTTLEVLVEEVRRRDRVAVGRSQYDAPEVDPLVYITGRLPSVGRMVPVEITDAQGYDLVGTLKTPGDD